MSFYNYFIYLSICAAQHVDLSSTTKGRTRAPCSESAESTTGPPGKSSLYNYFKRDFFSVIFFLQFFIFLFLCYHSICSCVIDRISFNCNRLLQGTFPFFQGTWSEIGIYHLCAFPNLRIIPWLSFKGKTSNTTIQYFYITYTIDPISWLTYISISNPNSVWCSLLRAQLW